MNFRFTNEFKASRLDEIVDYTRGARLWMPDNHYPDIDAWAQRAWNQLRHGDKRAIIALDNRKIVGVTIYQSHKEQPDALELKNITVRPEKRGRYIASFLLRNTEIEGKRDFKSKYLLVDAKARNKQIMYFFYKHNYQIIDRQDLYGLGAGDDLVYRKELVGTV